MAVLKSEIPLDVYRMTQVTNKALYDINEGEDWEMSINRAFETYLGRTPSPYDLCTVVDFMPYGARRLIAEKIMEKRKGYVGKEEVSND